MNDIQAHAATVAEIIGWHQRNDFQVVCSLTRAIYRTKKPIIAEDHFWHVRPLSDFIATDDGRIHLRSDCSRAERAA